MTASSERTYVVPTRHERASLRGLSNSVAGIEA
jgi:hypothetical protein